MILNMTITTGSLYKQINSLPAASGIYRIWNEQTGDSYVGASKNIRLRCFQHFSRLSSGQSSKALTDAFKPGSGSAAIEVLTLCDVEQLDTEERRFIRQLKPSLNGARPYKRVLLTNKSVTMAEAARLKGCSRQAIHAAIKRGDLMASMQIVQVTVWAVDKKSLSNWKPSPNMQRAGRKPRKPVEQEK
jgi:hypothetical protein